MSVKAGRDGRRKMEGWEINEGEVKGTEGRQRLAHSHRLNINVHLPHHVKFLNG